MNYEQIASELRLFESKDFENYVPERLNELIDALMELPNPELGIPELFAFIERLPDSDLGSPGPIVHALERMNYVDELEASIRRRPTPLSIWMVNRVLNSSLPRERRQCFIDLLASVEAHPRANDAARSEARDFIEFQSKRLTCD